jgi:Ni,Fe-hydrogenase III small subunit
MFYVLKRLWKHGLATVKLDEKDLAHPPSPPLKRSIHVRHIDSGSPNGCEWELTALLNPVYDIQRFGFDFVASPRHADVLLVTGGVTRNMEQAVRMTYEATPAPKVVVAIGDDACGTGMVGATYAQFGGVDRILPVDVYVPGDPPTPAEILQGMLQAALKFENLHRLL